MTSAQDDLVRHFLAGCEPLIVAGLQEQRPGTAERIATDIAAGKGRLLLVAELGRDGEVAIELTAQLGKGEHRLLSLVRR